MGHYSMTKPMIDIHVLTHSGTRPEWLQQCLDSLKNQPVVVHVVDNTGFSVGAGRARGFQLGTHEFVAYVDSDDYVLPGHYRACLAKLNTHRAVVSKEHVEYEDGRRHPMLKSNHNGAVYRREDVMPLLGAMGGAPLTVDLLTRRHIKPTQLPHAGYVWRIHSAGQHRLITPVVADREYEAWQQKVK